MKRLITVNSYTMLANTLMIAIAVNSYTMLANTLMIAIAMLMTALLFSQPRSADGDGPGYHFRPGPQLAEWIKLSYAAPRGKKPNHLLRHT
jgi:hypothetical protein